MSYICDKYCYKCDKVTSHINNNCSICKEKQKTEEEAKKLKAFFDLSTDEKLVFIFNKLEKLETSFKNLSRFDSINKPLY